AEYTGQSLNEGTDLAAIDNQIDASLLGDVAAARTQAGLELAQRALAVATVRTQLARAAVARAAVVRDHARHRLVGARDQVAISRHDVVLATQWATIPGRAPSSPIAALAKIEGPLGRQAGRHRVKPSMGPAAQSGLSSFTVTTGPQPGSVVAPTAVPAAATTTAPATASTSVSATPGTGLGQGPIGSSQGPASAPDLSSQGPAIIGTSLLGTPQIVAWFTSTGARANTTVPISQLVSDYLKAGQVTGVRGDIAFAQSIVETGYFAFPTFGQDPARYNNFAGIGACDSCKHGWKFPTAMAGVMSQELLLAAYATPPAQAPSGSQAPLGVEGCCRTWMGLSGVWASNKAYGFEILSIYHQMLEYSLADDLAKAGLATVVPAGPGPLSAPVVTSTTQPLSRPVRSSPTPSQTGRS
ncbi:MAG TPA: glucosaminidase domain-containing protein, partial [Acidimicrobiales bacterium]|nr:glucosaminidase domain-containing protein [Acidimicrobiales bacterium]